MPSEIEQQEKRKELVRSWVESNLVDGDWIDAERLGVRTEIYSTKVTKQLYDFLIDGFRPSPEWHFSDIAPPDSSLLFSGLAALLSESAACWVTFLCHDDAYLEIKRVIPAATDARYVSFVGHWHLRTEPADEAGTTAVGLLFEDFEDLFLFSDGIQFDTTGYPRAYRIEHFGGRRLEALSAHIKQLAEQGVDLNT
ncbi:MAG: hypothetical protein ACSHYF_09795 [Verrucomicrobiaceae bacterium]